MPKGAGVFHLKTNTPILVGFCILSKDFTYHLSFEELDVERLSDNSNEAILEINQRYSKLLEKAVREYPQQYFWFHRKWARKNYKGLSRF
jgi:KDO2-lipid IV(A) lauroyltransferase